MGLMDINLKIIFLLVLAGLFGWIIGYLLGRILGSANATELLNDYEEKMRQRDLELHGLRGEVNTAQAHISSLETERSTLAATLKTRENWLTEMEARNNELQADLDARLSELEELKAKIKGEMERDRAAEIARLKVQVTELEMMARSVKEPVIKVSPSSARPPSPGERDDLKKIFGIGPVLERLLNSHGIYCFQQIADWSAQDVQHYDQLLKDFRGRIVRDHWIDSARKEYHKKYGAPL
jgi:predicted flap endonuclease-1-like 5' DNA nuclease